jgi:hypothetical protein
VPLTNLAASLVATAPSPATSGTSLVVTTGEGALFPTTAFYAVAHDPAVLPTSLTAEIVKVTARSTDTFTITRAQRGTTAKSIAVGWRIYQAILAEDIDGAVRTITTSDTLTDDDHILLVDCSAGAVTLTLPAVATRKRPYHVKKIDIGVNAITIDGNGSEVIDDQLTFVFNDLLGAYMFVPGGGKWWVF